MFLKQLWAGLFSQPRKRTDRGNQRNSGRCRPISEALEDRLAPANFTVTIEADVVDSNDGQLSLREAVANANNKPGDDKITPSGRDVQDRDPRRGRGPQRYGQFRHQQRRRQSDHRRAGKDQTFIDAQQLDRVFDILDFTGKNRAMTLTLKDLTIINGRVDGGGFFADLSEVREVVSFVDFLVDRNTAMGDGGALPGPAPLWLGSWNRHSTKTRPWARAAPWLPGMSPAPSATAASRATGPTATAAGLP
jgi:hypothetical protein